jgi:hypothetical protein
VLQQYLSPSETNVQLQQKHILSQKTGATFTRFTFFTWRIHFLLMGLNIVATQPSKVPSNTAARTLNPVWVVVPRI